MRNALEELLKTHHGRRRPTILGLREHIFTGRCFITRLVHVQSGDKFCDHWPTNFGEPSKSAWSEVEAIKRVLRCFEIVSGLRINFHKSVVCGVGVDDELVKEYAAKLNCLGQQLPLKYLGLPLGANPSRRQTWKPIIEKVKKKLAGWKRKLLSFAG
ncbi:unnamed protein product [Camellia sinensis]